MLFTKLIILSGFNILSRVSIILLIHFISPLTDNFSYLFVKIFNK